MKIAITFALLLCCLLSVQGAGHGNGMGKKEKKGHKAVRGNPTADSSLWDTLGNGFSSFADLLNSQSDNPRERGDRGFPSAVPADAERYYWNRTLSGLEVEESAWYRNSSSLPVVVVRSVDRQLKDVNFTGAVSLTMFGENRTLRAVRLGFRQKSSLCLLLPEMDGTLQDVETELAARNGTVITAPAPLLLLNATEDRLGFSELMALYEEYKPLYFLCGFWPIFNVTLVDSMNAMEPMTEGGEQERLVKIMTLDKEINVLVPKKGGNGRFRGNGRHAEGQGHPRGRGQAGQNRP